MMSASHTGASASSVAAITWPPAEIRMGVNSSHAGSAGPLYSMRHVMRSVAIPYVLPSLVCTRWAGASSSTVTLRSCRIGNHRSLIVHTYLGPEHMRAERLRHPRRPGVQPMRADVHVHHHGDVHIGHTREEARPPPPTTVGRLEHVPRRGVAGLH